MAQAFVSLDSHGWYRDRDTHLLILDRTEGFAHWSFARGGLFRLVYGEPELDVSFTSLGFVLFPQMTLQSLHVFQFEGGHFRDVTEDFRADPTQFLLDEADVDYGPVEPELIRVEPGRVFPVGLAALSVLGETAHIWETQVCRDVGGSPPRVRP